MTETHTHAHAQSDALLKPHPDIKVNIKIKKKAGENKQAWVGMRPTVTNHLMQSDAMHSS